MSLTLLINSLAVSVVATAVAVLAGLCVALASVSAGPRGFRFGCGVMVANLALPPFLSANTWLEITASWRALTSAERVAWESLPMVAYVLASLLWPISAGVAVSAWSRLRAEQLEADPCCRGGRLFRGLLWPAAHGELRAAAAVTLVLALANFTVPTLFQVRVFTEEFWVRFNTQFDTAGALRAAWPLIVIPCLLLLLFRNRPVQWPRWQPPLAASHLSRQLGTLTTIARIASTLWVGMTLGVPLARLVLTERTWMELPGAFAAGTGALLNSLDSAVVCATWIVLVGLVIGQGVHFRWVRTSLWLGFLIPGVLLGVGLIFLFNRPVSAAFYQSAGVVWLALTLRYAAPGIALVRSALESCDSNLAAAARSLGATRSRVFWEVTLAQAAPGLAVAWYAVYVLCLWDVESVVLIQPPGGETLALRIFNLLHYGHAAQVNALCVIMLGLALAPLPLGWLVFSLSPRHRSVPTP